MCLKQMIHPYKTFLTYKNSGNKKKKTKKEKIISNSLSFIKAVKLSRRDQLSRKSADEDRYL